MKVELRRNTKLEFSLSGGRDFGSSAWICRERCEAFLEGVSICRERNKEKETKEVRWLITLSGEEPPSWEYKTLEISKSCFFENGHNLHGIFKFLQPVATSDRKRKRCDPRYQIHGGKHASCCSLGGFGFSAQGRGGWTLQSSFCPHKSNL
jgi:hypothetical protein